MIGIDLKMPECCTNCPMVYHIRSGPYEGLYMCQGLESQLIESGKQCITGRCIIDGWDQRDEKCPLIEFRGGIIK